MSLARPAKCLFCSFSRAASAVGPRVPRRQFHPTPTYLNDRKPDLPNAKPEDIKTPRDPKRNTPEQQAPKQNKTANEAGEVAVDANAQVPVDTNVQPEEKKTLEEIVRNLKPENFQPYTAEQKAHLAKVYTPEQIAAIEAGEASIDPKDMAEQFGVRRDPMKLLYVDDFSVVEPGVDKHIRAPESNSEYNPQLKTEEDFAADFGRFFAEMPENGSVGDWVRFVETLRVTKGKEEAELNPHSAMVPDLFGPGESLSGQKQQQEMKETEEKGKESEEMTDALKRLLQDTGFDAMEIRTLRTKTLVAHSVVNQTRLGKVRRQYCLSIAGNGDGLLGIGEAKSEEAPDAALQSKYRAIRNMQPILRYENRTIFGDVLGKVGAVELKLMNRAPGFGLRCQHLIFEMCRAAGIHDLAARVDRSRNPMNTVKAAYEALMSQRNPEDIARARGKKLVDVRKVYYSGRITN
ncbi:mitochondrial 37S ribosomal protein uS5m [Aspergillus chevalieri]|uniref:Small ribosomal subunit protein uS5m n=1 Tax=Aspergillus chevalieri TaxID=182096 RepID=A0A7R7VPS5_ASPCH|nr:28S ribosomal protein S5, mitochondrial [Aspergillus chevalieri]BCR88590.1 28S ribosomal protein S5, mitochondrial [Aspergillus chevalieri]